MKIYQFNGKSNICGENIRRIREYQKLTQAQLAARLQSRYNVQLEQRSISRIEIGERFLTDYEVLAISKALKVDIKSLYEGFNIEQQGGRVIPCRLVAFLMTVTCARSVQVIVTVFTCSFWERLTV